MPLSTLLVGMIPKVGRTIEPIGRRTIMCMLLIAALALIWNLLQQ